MGQVLPGAGTDIEELQFHQPCDGVPIVRKSLALEEYGPLKLQSEPVQILQCAGHMLWFAALPINVLDADQKAPATRPCHLSVEKGGIGVTQMEPAIGAGRKAENRLNHACFLRRLAAFVKWFHI